MKKLVLLGFVAMIAVLTGCTRVEPGWVGIKVNQAGSAKGVEDYPLQTGWVFYNFFTTKVYDYPTFQQNVVWSRSNKSDESISFNSIEGAQINADVAASFKFKGERVPYTFVKFRTEPDVIIHTYVRNEVRDVLQRLGSKQKAMDILGASKSQFLDDARKELNARLVDYGEFDYVTFANDLRVDQRVTDSINANIQQIQETIKAQQKVLQVKAEADQAAARAEGEQRSKIAVADGEAQAILLKAKAQADANKLVRDSLTTEVIQSIALEKWNGVLPNVTGASIPFIGLNSTSTNK